MTLRVRELRLRAVTGAGTFGVDLSFLDGLNVITAANTSGKSTAAQAILYALGLEAMLGPARDAPLPHAMTHAVEDESGSEHDVLESQVLLQIEDDSGEPLTIRRYVKHPTVDPRLVSVWPTRIDQLDSAGVSSEDFFLRDQGAATRESGFHHFLAGRLGWELPEVARYKGGSGPLYIETIAPLFFVEQKRGWGGIQALTPTHFQIRDVKRRALEFILDLDVQSREKLIAELRSMQRDISADWSELVGELAGAAEVLGATVTKLPGHPASEWPLEVPPAVQVVEGDGWVSIDSAIGRLREEIQDREAEEVPTVQQSADGIAQRLTEMEDQLNAIRAASTESSRQLSLEEATAAAAVERLDALNEDIRRHRDIEKLQGLGSEAEVVLDHDDCPTCHRPLVDALLDPDNSPPVMGIEESIKHLEGHRQLLTSLVEDAKRVVTARRARMTAQRNTAADLRTSMRAARESLVAPESLPSVADIERRLSMRSRLERLEKFCGNWEVNLERLGELSARWRATAAELTALLDDDFSDGDREKLEMLEVSFRGQLSQYGFESCPVDQVILSPDDYMPTHEGFQLTWDLSASDGIRMIWAYLLGLMDVDREFETNHPGLLVLDEPGQQAMAEISVDALLGEAHRIATPDRQVVLVMSESTYFSKDMATDADLNVVQFEGKLLQRIGD